MLISSSIHSFDEDVSELIFGVISVVISGIAAQSLSFELPFSTFGKTICLLEASFFSLRKNRLYSSIGYPKLLKSNMIFTKLTRYCNVLSHLYRGLFRLLT